MAAASACPVHRPHRRRSPPASPRRSRRSDRLGAETLSADAVVHELLGSERVRELLVERWGDEVAPGRATSTAAGSGAIVFERPGGARLARVGASSARRRADRRLARRSCPTRPALAVVEVPLLFETGLEAPSTRRSSVVADDAMRAERAGARGTGDARGPRAAPARARRRRPPARPTWSPTTAPSAELEAALAELLAAARRSGERAGVSAAARLRHRRGRGRGRRR